MANRKSGNRIVLSCESYGAYSITELRKGGSSRLVQSDWDFPNLAQSFGWRMDKLNTRGKTACAHRGTDGTVRCPDCGRPASYFIDKARAWLDAHDGKTILANWDEI